MGTGTPLSSPAQSCLVVSMPSAGGKQETSVFEWQGSHSRCSWGKWIRLIVSNSTELFQANRQLEGLEYKHFLPICLLSGTLARPSQSGSSPCCCSDSVSSHWTLLWMVLTLEIQLFEGSGCILLGQIRDSANIRWMNVTSHSQIFANDLWDSALR